MSLTCAECGRAAARLRKDRCDACYMRLYRNGELPGGAACRTCGERRRPVLTQAQVGEEKVVLCGNCALVLGRVRPRVDSVAKLEARVQRERRREERRRALAATDVERRQAGRRASDAVRLLDLGVD
jgi:hypothetical protein